MFYLQLNSDAEFVSISSDKNCSDANLGIAKNLIQQFTPKLNKQLFQSKTGSSSTYFGRALGEVTNPEPASEEHPQGYIQPKRTIENEDKNSITIQKRLIIYY